MKKKDKKRVPVRERPPEERINDFKEVPIIYSEEEAKKEASRCIECANPQCIGGCPVDVKIQQMIKKVAEGKFKEAFFLLKDDNPVPSAAGRVCPQEDQCEGECVIGNMGDPINIGKIEAFLGDWAREHGIKEEVDIEERSENVAVIGSGPSGISCVADLRKAGYNVTLFEALHKAGGVLRYGIPAFRLPKDILDYELNHLEELGVEIKLNHVVGQTVKFEQLKEKYDAVFLGTGAGAPRFLGIEGEELNGVYSANEFLIRTNLMKSYKFPEYDTPLIVGDRVGVIGAGNVAMDAARSALRQGAEEVYILYRRTKDWCPAREEEVKHAIDEGVQWKELCSPVKITGDKYGWVKEIQMCKTELCECEDSDRPRPERIEDSEIKMELDTIIEAIGQKPNRVFLSQVPELETKEWGGIKVDENFATNLDGVFAGGDAISGGATVIRALGEGRNAAESIKDYLENK